MPLPNRTNEKTNRKSNYLFKTLVPRLLQKPASRWTKDELRDAIWLHFNRPNGGLITASSMQELEARLRGGSNEKSFPRLKRRGRPPLMTEDKYRWMYQKTEELRQRMAQEKQVPVTDKQVARRVAEKLLRKDGRPSPPEYKIIELARHCENRIKAFRKKLKAGEK
jgi:hypothetical protein